MIWKDEYIIFIYKLDRQIFWLVVDSKHWYWIKKPSIWNNAWLFPWRETDYTSRHYYHLITNKNTYIKIHKKSAIMDTLIKSLLKHRMLTTKLLIFTMKSFRKYSATSISWTLISWLPWIDWRLETYSFNTNCLCTLSHAKI